MTAIPKLDEDECYLAAILDDPSGIELAEFLWIDEEQPDGIFRCWDFQWGLFRHEETFQIDYCGRSIGKSTGIIMRAFAFPFNFPGQEMLITAPELNHLRPVTDKVEHQIKSHRITREMLPKQRGDGINHQPQFQAQFSNNARIISRLPQKSGLGVKGSVISSSVILTSEAMKSAADVKIGDLVLTHEGRWRPVLHVYRHQAETAEVSGWGNRGLTLSMNHRVYVRRNRGNSKTARQLELHAQWLSIDDPCVTNAFWASPSKFPELELPDTPDGITDALPLLELAGRYVADGHLEGNSPETDRWNRVGFTDDLKGIECIESLIRILGYEPKRRSHDNAHCVMVNNTELSTWLRLHFGRLSHGKHVPVWLLGAPAAARAAFLDGYLAGDGHWAEDRQRWEMGTASAALAQGLRLLGQSLGWAGMHSWVDPKVTHISGVKLKKDPQRSFRVQLSRSTRMCEGGGMLWGKIRSVRPVGIREVIDLVVAEDHSYVADGIVHLGSAFLPDGRNV